MGTTLYGALVIAGYEPHSYSGRGMFGKECVAVNLDSSNELANVGAALAAEGVLSQPSIDGMGRGIVAYWPSEPWMPEGQDGVAE